jgi:hypothetical protein
VSQKKVGCSSSNLCPLQNINLFLRRSTSNTPFKVRTPLIIFFATIFGETFDSGKLPIRSLGAELVLFASVGQIPHLKGLHTSLECCLTPYMNTFFTFQVASSQNVNKCVLFMLFLLFNSYGQFPRIEHFPKKCRKKNI